MDHPSLTGPSDSLLRTKLRIPTPPSHRIVRPRVTDRLNEGLNHKLTLISAPPGFGKTTCISEWISQSRYCVAWLSLDDADNDPVRFWAYVIAALQTINSGIGEKAFSLLQASSSVRIESALAALVNEIDLFSDSFALVLDDYHVIESSSIHQGLTLLLEQSLPRMHLMIASRADPPLPLAQLRAQAELVEVREADLRFTLDETSAYLNAGMGLNLSVDQVAELGRRTEGWVAGLQLAALSLRKHDTPAQFITSFAGSHRFITDYLTDQVLTRQSQDLQDFLLQTSILDHLTAPLCDAITGRTDSQEILQQLEARNLFLIPLDAERRWYRYHRLFVDVLRHRLDALYRDTILDLHRRASGWLAQNGLTSEALSHAIAGHDWERATHLIVLVAEILRQRGEIATLTHWIKQLPDDIRREHPAACLAYARVLIDSAQFASAEEFIAEAEHALESNPFDKDTPVETLKGQALALRASLSITRGDFALAIDRSHRALELLPADQLAWHSLVALNLAGAYRFSSNWAAASQTYLEAGTLSQSIGDWMNALSAFGQRGEALQAQGQLRQAVRQYDQVLELAQAWRLTGAPVIGYALVGLARVWCEWNDLDAALVYAQSGLERGNQANILDISLRGYLVLARIHQAQNDASGALNALGEADAIAHRMGVAEIKDWIDALRAQSWLASGDTEAAFNWARLFTGKLNDAVYPGVPYGLAQVWLAQGEPEKAIPLLDHAIQSAEAVGRSGNVIHLLALKAIALHALGNFTQALTVLGQALELAEHEGYVRAFVEAGPPMMRLLQRFVARGETANYVKQLLAALGDPSSIELALSTELVESLTQRERQILRLIVDGATNQEIAHELVLTVNTVKKHTSNIFAKLGVSSRTQAIARARELNLL